MKDLKALILALAEKWDNESEERAGYADQRLDEEHYHVNNTMAETLADCANAIREAVKTSEKH